MTNQFELAAPAPLQSLTQRVVSPANIAIEARQNRAMPLSFGKRQQIRKEIKRINAALKRGQYQELLSVYAALRERLQPLQETYAALKIKVEENPEDTEAADSLKRFKEEIRPEVERWQALKSGLEPFRAMARRRDTLQHQLDDHPIAVARVNAERKLRRDMEKEARIYANIIITNWTRLGFCHRYTEKGKEKTHHVSFDRIAITHDAIYFKILASHKTAFNNWVSELPQGVYVASQLLDPKTLTELSIACQKQVTGEHSTNGAWVIVHRLESVDGLMNYVKFSDVMERYPENYRHKMPVPVGVTYNREIQWVNIHDFNNWLIGGYTGSGKSNAVNVKICSLIMTQAPKDLRLVLIDLKGGLEFDLYAGIPHLHGGIVTEVTEVADRLAEMESIMEMRFKKMRGVAKDIQTYNLKRPNDHLPHILIVFDEVASIQGHGEVTKRITASLLSLTRLGRAVGIHTDLCTQHPNVKVIEGSIKGNMNAILSGRMQTSAASTTVLGNGSAATLAAIQGRMMLQISPDPLPVQTPHIDLDDIAACLKAAKAFPTPEPLEVGVVRRLIHQQWTPEMIIDFALTHLDGLVSGRRLFDAIGDEGLSQMQANRLAKEVWDMAPITYKEKVYIIEKRRGGARYLVEKPEETPAVEAEVLETEGVST